MERNLQAEALFNAIVESPDPVITINDMVKHGYPESVYLEYKVDGDGDNKKNFAKSLSGFANTAGGVLVWGVKCKSGVSPSGIEPVKDIQRLISNLSQWVSCIVEEAVPNVDIRPIPLQVGASEGFVVVHIPHSRRRPHRTTLEKEFYLRTTDNFRSMEVPLLRALFYPHTYSRLEVVFRVVFQSSIMSGFHLEEYMLVAELRNEGPSSARELLLALPMQMPSHLDLNYPWSRLVQTAETLTARLDPNVPTLHPGHLIPLFTVRLGRDRLSPTMQAFHLQFKVYKNDQIPTEFELSFSQTKPEMNKSYLARVLPDVQ
jgi:hypothetical protein